MNKDPHQAHKKLKEKLNSDPDFKERQRMNSRKGGLAAAKKRKEIKQELEQVKKELAELKVEQL